ncbi:hypothetical protein J6590_091580 [Homalodisca vitripennis]|nr:hypothetical protein J6590_091580 [Homalodisca vitripennis]
MTSWEIRGERGKSESLTKVQQGDRWWPGAGHCDGRRCAEPRLVRRWSSQQHYKYGQGIATSPLFFVVYDSRLNSDRNSNIQPALVKRRTARQASSSLAAKKLKAQQAHSQRPGIPRLTLEQQYTACISQTANCKAGEQQFSSEEIEGATGALAAARYTSAHSCQRIVRDSVNTSLNIACKYKDILYRNSNIQPALVKRRTARQASSSLAAKKLKAQQAHSQRPGIPRLTLDSG